ncbi:unnamed protein product [Ceutorhynchus assimilis]|uniref:Uncharacterized protein n=1 Tax=Ceutorhynchus assimilis TaxID=467358 RepID=A0A9P0DLS4_9CUCU|nr:unnamed protein product [Ceutorhynchus assimilis]
MNRKNSPTCFSADLISAQTHPRTLSPEGLTDPLEILSRKRRNGEVFVEEPSAAWIPSPEGLTDPLEFLLRIKRSTEIADAALRALIPAELIHALPGFIGHPIAELINFVIKKFFGLAAWILKNLIPTKYLARIMPEELWTFFPKLRAKLAKRRGRGRN